MDQWEGWHEGLKVFLQSHLLFESGMEDSSIYEKWGAGEEVFSSPVHYSKTDVGLLWSPFYG